MSYFNKEDFLKANESAKSGKGDFPDVPSGIYILNVMDFKLRKTKNGAVQYSVGYEIDPEENSSYGGQWIFDNQTVYNTDGQPNDIGLIAMNRTCNRLSDGLFDPSAFLNDEEGELSKFVGTKVQARVKMTKSGENGQYTNYDIVPQKLLYNAYQEKRKKPENPVLPSEETIDLEIGQTIVYKKDGGLERKGLVKGFIEDAGQIVVQYTTGKDEKITEVITADTVIAILAETQEELDLELEEEEEKKTNPIVVGTKVSFDFKGMRQGVITEINENEGKAKVKFNMDGQEKSGWIGLAKLIPF